MNIEYVKTENLQPFTWQVTHMLRPDLNLLRKSMNEYGWLTPIIARKEDGTIIDGFHRWVVAQESKKLSENVPVIWVDVDEPDAIIMHIVLNRTKAETIPKFLSDAVNQIVYSAKYSEEDIRLALGMTYDEFDVLRDGTIIKVRKIKEHKYSNAWVPVETSGTSETIAIERPPTKDK